MQPNLSPAPVTNTVCISSVNIVAIHCHVPVPHPRWKTCYITRRNNSSLVTCMSLYNCAGNRVESVSFVKYFFRILSTGDCFKTVPWIQQMMS